MSGIFAALGGIGTGTNPGSAQRSAEIERIGSLRLGDSMLRFRIQRRTCFALTSLPSAMPVTEALASQQAAITACLNSSG